MRIINRYISLLCVLALLCIVLTGCKDEEGRSLDQEGFVGMEAEPDLNYEVPEKMANILVSQTGYGTLADKEVIFQGKKIPLEFYVVNVETKQEVFRGDVVVRGDLGYGDFTSLTTPGTYAVMADSLGSSYYFEIGDGLYKEFGDAFLEKLEQAVEIPKNSHIEAMILLLFSYELYPDIYAQDSGGDNGNVVGNAPDKRLAIVKQWLENYESQSGSEKTKDRESKEAVTAYDNEEILDQGLYSALLVKFAYLIRNTDPVLANSYERIAEQNWNKLNKSISANDDSYDEDKMFFLTTELFRYTSYQKYHAEIYEYMENASYDLQNPSVLLALMTYLSTKKIANITLCTDAMHAIMMEAEQINMDSKGSPYFVKEDAQKDMEKLLWNMVIVSISDSIIATKEYADLLENHVYYLLGRNADSICYMDLEGIDHLTMDSQIRPEERNGVAFFILLSGIRQRDVSGQSS